MIPVFEHTWGRTGIVVDQYINWLTDLKEARSAFVLSDVGHHGLNTHPSGLQDVRSGLVQASLISSIDVHIGTFSGQCAGTGHPQTLRRCANQGHSTFDS